MVWSTVLATFTAISAWTCACPSATTSFAMSASPDAIRPADAPTAADARSIATRDAPPTAPMPMTPWNGVSVSNLRAKLPTCRMGPSRLGSGLPGNRGSGRSAAWLAH